VIATRVALRGEVIAIRTASINTLRRPQ